MLGTQLGLWGSSSLLTHHRPWGSNCLDRAQTGSWLWECLHLSVDRIDQQSRVDPQHPMTVGAFRAETVETPWLHKRAQSVARSRGNHCEWLHTLRAPWLPGVGHCNNIHDHTEHSIDPLCGSYGSMDEYCTNCGITRKHWSPWKRRGEGMTILTELIKSSTQIKKKTYYPTWCHPRYLSHPRALTRAPGHTQHTLLGI